MRIKVVESSLGEDFFAAKRIWKRAGDVERRNDAPWLFPFPFPGDSTIPVGRDGRGAARFLFYACINHAGDEGVAGTLPYPLLPCPSIHLVPLRLTTNFSSRPTFFPPVRRPQRSLFTRFLHTFHPTHTSSLVSCPFDACAFPIVAENERHAAMARKRTQLCQSQNVGSYRWQGCLFRNKKEIHRDNWRVDRLDRHPRIVSTEKWFWASKLGWSPDAARFSVFRFILSLFATTNHACTSRDGTWKRVLFALCRLCRVLRKRIE